MTPAVSVCVPAYRQPALLTRAIKSIFSQDFNDFEVIVTDDTESDEIKSAVVPWVADNRLRYFRNSHRLGSPANWNHAMSFARGRYIKILHHDDWLSSSTSLRKYVTALEENRSVSFVFSSSQSCDANGEKGSIHSPTCEQLTALEQAPEVLVFGNIIGAPSAIIFRRPPEFAFDEALQWVVDIDAYLRLLSGGVEFKFIAEPLVCVSSGMSHQVTHLLENNPVLRVAEHLHLYSKARLHWSLRPAGLGFVFRLLRGLDSTSLMKLSEHPLCRHSAGEIRLAILARGMMLVANRALARISTP